MPRLITNLWFDTEAHEAAENYCSIFPDSEVTWQVCPDELGELLGDPDPARAARAFEAMLTMSRIDLAAVRSAADG